MPVDRVPSGEAILLGLISRFRTTLAVYDRIEHIVIVFCIDIVIDHWLEILILEYLREKSRSCNIFLPILINK